MNPKFATYFHQSGQLITIKMLIKPLFIFNEQYLLLVIIVQTVVSGHFEQIGANNWL